MRSSALPLAQPRRLVAVLTALALLTGILVATTATAAPASAASRAVTNEAAFVKKINAVRKTHGLRPLTVRADLVAVARKQAKRMASQKKLHHNPKLASDVRNYRWVGENVGYGPTVARLHSAFMASPSHKANIVDKGYSEVGVGIVIRGGTIWVVEVFRQPT